MCDQNVVHGIRRNRVLSTLMDDHHSSVNVGQDFKLKSGREFEDRAQSVFSGLLEAEFSKNVSAMNEEDSPAGSDDDDDSRFVKPRARAPKRRIANRGPMPDYVKSPKKWKKYSLSDVPDHSEKANSKAAAEFLASVKKNKHAKELKDHDTNEIRFSKPIQGSTSEQSDASSSDVQASLFSRSARVMPEYVVGQKTSQRKVNVARNEKRAEIRLSHLDDSNE